MKLIKQIEHPEVKIHIYETFDENLLKMRYSYQFITSLETQVGGLEPNVIIFEDMKSAVIAAHLLLPDNLKELMKLEYILM